MCEMRISRRTLPVLLSSKKNPDRRKQGENAPFRLSPSLSLSIRYNLDPPHLLRPPYFTYLTESTPLEKHSVGFYHLLLFPLTYVLTCLSVEKMPCCSCMLRNTVCSQLHASGITFHITQSVSYTTPFCNSALI